VNLGDKAGIRELEEVQLTYLLTYFKRRSDILDNEAFLDISHFALVWC